MIKIHFDIYHQEKQDHASCTGSTATKIIQVPQDCLNSIIRIFQVANTLLALILLCN